MFIIRFCSVIKYVLVLIVISVCSFTSKGQGEYNIWYFGNMAGLDFNTTPPTAITSSNTYVAEGTSGICDRNGNLVLYTNDDSIYNYKHQLIKNGLYTIRKQSPTQGFMALPHPSKSYNYYIFSTPDLSLNDSFIRYSLIDMSLNNGNGEVVAKEIPIMPGNYERLAVTAHENDRDYWVAGIESKTLPGTVEIESYFNCARTVNGNMGVALPPQKIIGNPATYNVKFSPDGNIFTGQQGWYNNGKKFFTLYKFNRSTGLLSNGLKITYAGINNLFFSEFSADSRFLYITYTAFSASPSSPFPFAYAQYDLSLWDSTAIASSEVIIHTKGNFPAGMQLGPDKKIYVFHNTTNYLGVINSPQLAGTACQYIDSAIYLKGRFNVSGAPYYPSFWFTKHPINLGVDTALCIGDTLVLDAKQPPDAKITWSTGDTTPTITIKQPGTYWVKAILGKETIGDTIIIKYKKRYKVFLGNDTAFCGAFNHLLDAGSAQSYKWNTGDTTVQKLINSAGIYSVTIKDTNTCPMGDTILIEQLKKPLINIGFDSVNCSFVTLSIPHQDSSVTYKWDTGDTSRTITVYQKGLHSITLSNLFCSITSTVNVNLLAMPKANLVADTIICKTPYIVLDAGDSGTYYWNTGETTSKIRIINKGKYWVTISRNGCSATDSVYVDDCRAWYFIPNAFSPGNDGLNDVFGVVGENILNVDMRIFDRWGENIFSQRGNEAYWDGTYKSIPCSSGIYTYIITITGYKRGLLVKENLAGTITLVR